MSRSIMISQRLRITSGSPIVRTKDDDGYKKECRVLTRGGGGGGYSRNMVNGGARL